ncbi:MAG: class I SAM-dependent DNA methyltransferase, partial [Phycisphaerales bacterium JB038]
MPSSTQLTSESPFTPQVRKAMSDLEIALPVPGNNLDQDEEWVLAEVDDEWTKIRLHDYGDVYAVPGLYEKWIYDVFQCCSPQVIRELLSSAIEAAGIDPTSLTVLDLGAGNGCVAEELQLIDIHRYVGLDIVPEAETAAERDRPGLYTDYVIGDLTQLPAEKQGVLDRYSFNCLACVAALGFGDIPPEVFAAAYNRIEDGGFIAFTIKTLFVDDDDPSGFSLLIHKMIEEGSLEI